jgi:hypothetical protein
MQAPHPTAPPARSGFVAAVLSLLFPGLGHLYLGARRRALGWAAPPFLLVALIGGFAIRMNIFELAGFVVQTWFLDGLFIANLALLVYRAAAIVDAWSIARRLGDPSTRSHAGQGAGAAAIVSVAGLAAVLLVMSVAHVAVARYDLLLSGTVNCAGRAHRKGPGLRAPATASRARSVRPWRARPARPPGTASRG